MQQYRILSMCPTSGIYKAIYFDAEDLDDHGNPTMFYLQVAAFGVVETTGRKGMAGPLVPHGEAGLVPAWLLDGYLDCAPEDETELGNEEHEASWLERWREEHPEEEEAPKKGKKRAPKTKVGKKEPAEVPEEEEEEEEEEDNLEVEGEEEEEEEEPPTEVHLSGRKR